MGKGDLNQTYDELLDYFFPRQLSPEMSHSCYLVVRYLPQNHRLHQLNIIFDKENVNSVWAFALPDGLVELESSDQAVKLAQSTHVKSWRVPLSEKSKASLVRRLRGGFLITLHPGIVLHGDVYRAWGDCDWSHFEAEVAVPANTDSNATRRMNALWKDANAGSR